MPSQDRCWCLSGQQLRGPSQTAVRGLGLRGPLALPARSSSPCRPSLRGRPGTTRAELLFLACPWRRALLLDACFLLGRRVREPLGHR